VTARPSGTEEPSSSHLWLGALVATLLLQATAAFLTRLVPTIAPVMLHLRPLPRHAGAGLATEVASLPFANRSVPEGTWSRSRDLGKGTAASLPS
jgi:hypothetical protein